ncbi:hypothetical protein HYFRA_00011722 [Hymenoscyphus fraxineus]|uniref:Uncharacterized protein n=1 Tax=Hymenoscyphus fraxineus TaxID=746836 RepID=A0A9N9L761_9HELO|nr:hypothetical protein HYFRA_00011722 [Hymenoscyphus fraxineus]
MPPNRAHNVGGRRLPIGTASAAMPDPLSDIREMVSDDNERMLSQLPHPNHVSLRRQPSPTDDLLLSTGHQRAGIPPPPPRRRRALTDGPRTQRVAALRLMAANWQPVVAPPARPRHQATPGHTPEPHFPGPTPDVPSGRIPTPSDAEVLARRDQPWWADPEQWPESPGRRSEAVLGRRRATSLHNRLVLFAPMGQEMVAVAPPPPSSPPPPPSASTALVLFSGEQSSSPLPPGPPGAVPLLRRPDFRVGAAVGFTAGIIVHATLNNFM